jgi:hypothetical protein
MSEMHVSGIPITRRFNHDLLIEDDDQAAAARRWPTVAPALVDKPLVAAFKTHERRAKAHKRSVQMLGSAAVLLTLAALVGYVAELSIAAAGRDDIPRLAFLSELSAVIALVLAVLASRFGPFRRRWLKHRFVAEVLRQWHFRRLLDGDALTRLQAGADRTDEELSALMSRLSGTVGEKMDELSHQRRDPLGPIPTARLPKRAETRAQLLDAYRTLRLDHQREFAVHKLSTEDKTFAGLSLEALSTLTELVAGTSLLLALVFAAARLMVTYAWAPVAALSLAVVGVAIRTWRDGIALESERERYHEMLYVLELLTERWEGAETDEQRFRTAEEIERASVEELRSFIRSHEQAQFLF